MVTLAICVELLVWALLVFALTRLVRRRIRHAGRQPNWSVGWKIAAIAAVPLLVFWEWLPTWVAYKQCSALAGFTVHKSLEQWRKENPGVAETLERFDARPADPRGQLKPLSATRFRKQLNQRFAYDTDHEIVFPNVQVWTYEVVDTANHETLARRIKITAGNHGGFASGGPGWWKFWTIHGPASPGEADFYTFLEHAAGIGRTR